MSFQSFGFLVFLLAMTIFCRNSIRHGEREGTRMLIFTSFLFYIWPLTYEVFWGTLILLGGIVVSWNVATYLAVGKRFRTAIFAAAVGWHVAILLISKYFGFLNAETMAEGWVPMGLSFFVIQQIWFLKRVYTGEFKGIGVVTNGQYTLYSLFFPTITAGPILRPDDFFPQVDSVDYMKPDAAEVAAGLYGIAVGMAKKVLLADSLGALVDSGWASASTLSAPSAWLVILAYALQLYLDFSGYCDIAAGAAHLFGFSLPINFDTPYRSLSVTEFWRRWHITLTNFLRECLYLPLGGSRRGEGRTYCNLLLVFFISGLWHGAGWTFVAWGLLHGLAMVAERRWGERRAALPRWAQWALTFVFVSLAWVFFRAPSLGAAFSMLRAAVAGGFALPAAGLFSGVLDAEATALGVLVPAVSGAAPVLAFFAVLTAAGLVSFLPVNTAREMEEFRPRLWKIPVAAVLLVWSILSFPAVGTFIYANF